MTTAAPAPNDVLEKVDTLGPPGTPVTTPEVAEGFDCTQRTIYNRLEALVDDGVLKTKKVGANSRVWWRPVDSDIRRNGGASDRRNPVSLRDGQSLSFTADGEMAERIREFEWADTPLGSMDEWPPELRVAVDVMLGADEAIGIYWGEDLTLLYNDLARDVIGRKHPNALGQPARDVFPEAWDTLGPIHEQVMAGDGAARLDEFLLPLERTDEIEDIWWDSSYSPIPLADGSIGGVFNIAIDITDRKRRERNTAFLEDLEAELTQLSTPEEIVATAGERINEYLDVGTYNMSSIDEDADTVDHLYVWEDGSVQPVPDTVSLSEFSTEEFRTAARAGDPIVSADTHGDRYTDARATETIDVRSFITVPFHRDGEWEYLLSLTDPDPREWREDEVELVQELANRLFPRLERARAEQALRESEQRYHRLFDSINESIDEAFFIVERVSGEDEGATDRDGPAEYRFVETNPAFEDFTGLTDVVGNRVTDLDLDGDLPGSDVWDEVVRTGDSRRFEIETTGGPLADGWYDVRVFPYGRSDSATVACLVDDITDRKETEMRLRESERRYRTVLNSMDEGFFLADVVFDRDGEPLDIFYRDSNPAATEFTGEEYTGRWLTEIDDEYEDYWFEIFGRVATTGEAERDVLYSGPDGIWCDFYVFKPEGAGSRRVAVIFQDVTERKEAERTLQQQADLNAFRVDLTDAIRPPSDPVEVQHEAARVLGEHLDVDRAHYGEVAPDGNTNTVRADYYRSDISSVAGEHHFDDYGEYIGDALQAGETLVVEDYTSISGLDDEQRAMYQQAEIAAFVCVPYVEEGRLTGYVLVTQSTPYEWTDLEIEMVEETANRTWAAVERARAEQELRESEARFRNVFENDMVPMGVWTEAGDIPDANDAFLDLLGYTREELDAGELDWIDLTPPEYHQRDQEAVAEVQGTGSTTPYEKEFVHKDGHRVPVVIGSGEFDERRDAGIFFAVDITDRKEAEQQLRESEARLAAELEAIERLQEVSTQPIQPDDGEVLYDAILDTAVDMLDADFGSLQRLDPDRNDLKLMTHRGFTEEAESAWDRVTIEHASTCGKALRTGERVMVSDVETSEFMAGTDDRGTYLQTGIRAVQTTPLISRDGDMLGMLSTHWADPHEPSERDLHLLDVLARQVADLMQQRSTIEALRESEERYRTLFESIDEGFCIVEVLFDEDDPVDYRFLETNPAFESQTGLTDAEGERMRALEPNHEDHWFETYGRIARAGEPERFQSPAKYLGDRWYDVYAFRIGDPEERKVAILFNDISELKHTQQALERLTVASQELIDADTETIHDRVAELTVDVLDVEYAALWQYDEVSGDLTETTSALDVETETGAVRHPDDVSEQVWQAFVGDEIAVSDDLSVDETVPGGATLRSRLLVPLGRHGVVCVGSLASNAFDERVIDLAETLGATLETAWDRADSERRLQTQNEELQRLDRLNTLIREIDQALVGAGTREEINEVVCERLADSDLYEFAWLGEHDPGTDVVEPRAWAGVDSGYVEDLTITVEDTPTNRDPIARAVRTGELQVIADIATDGDFAPWREATLERGARSLICIPLVYDDVAYGVLTVYADHPQSDEDERNQDVLSELGDTIAHTINARETRETLQTDNVVELTLRFADADTPLCRLARETECTIEHQGFVPRASGQADVYFIARDISPEELLATAQRSLPFDDLDCLTEGADGSLFRARVSDPTLAARITDEGAVVRSITIEAGDATVVLDVPHTAAVREFLDRLRQWNPDFELHARQSRERPLKTRQTFATALEDHLTDRQREVLQTAYLSGFFETPRVSNGQEVTELLGVSQPTFSEHLRAAERTLCEVLFEAGSHVESLS